MQEHKKLAPKQSIKKENYQNQAPLSLLIKETH